MSTGFTLPRRRLRVRDLPHVERVEHGAWREGWWQGLMVGCVLGLACGVIIVKVA